MAEASESLTIVSSEADKNPENIILIPEFKGRRAILLEKALSKTMQKCLCIKFALFLKNYSSLSKNKENTLEVLHKAFIQQLQSNVSAEIQQMYKEENVLSLLTNLDQLIVESSPTGHTWRPSGVEDLKPHLMSIKLKEIQYLKEQLEKVQRKNQLLKVEVENQKKYLVETMHEIENEVHVLDQILNFEPNNFQIEEILET